VSEILRVSGFDVVEAENGEIGYHSLSEHGYRMVLLHVQGWWRFDASSVLGRGGRHGWIARADAPAPTCSGDGAQALVQRCWKSSDRLGTLSEAKWVRDTMYPLIGRARSHRLVAKDTTLSRWRHGFESRWDCQQRSRSEYI
jgi:hypothetical protein